MNSRLILLIDDNPSDVELTKRALEKRHISNALLVAEDGKEALDYLFATGAHAGRDVKDLPTLVLLDLKLPKLDGLEVSAADSRGPANQAVAGGDPHLLQ